MIKDYTIIQILAPFSIQIDVVTLIGQETHLRAVKKNLRVLSKCKKNTFWRFVVIGGGMKMCDKIATTNVSSYISGCRSILNLSTTEPAS